ncbi:MAG: contractile injection system tape measure protein [Chitinophagaceae bacterium]
MSKQNNHIILKQKVEIAFENMNAGMGIQDAIAGIIKERLQPQMEVLFDELADEEHRIQLDQLEIDCGELSADNWQQEWVDNAIVKLRAALLGAHKTKIKNENFHQDFFYFLQYGLLPWNSSVKELKNFEENIVFDSIFFKAFEAAMRDQQMAQRLLNQFSEKFTTAFVKALIQHYEKQVKRLSAFHSLIKQPVIIRPQKEAVMKAIVYEFSAQAKDKEQTHKAESIDFIKKDEQEISKEIFVNNAGLVLLHPFLPRLFENLQLTNKQEWVNDEAQQTALAVTVFLTTGEIALPEFEMPLNKIICGLPVSTVLEKIIPISVEEQQACDELLAQVIKMWRSLKNTSVPAFRETFLQRMGKLSKRDNGWLLQPEQKGVDVLLSSLPWGIGVIKLPWMEEIVFTEWG